MESQGSRASKVPFISESAKLEPLSEPNRKLFRNFGNQSFAGLFCCAAADLAGAALRRGIKLCEITPIILEIT